MRITSLDLENIKSYRQARIDFTTGLNAVCGLNGSGKTTVLEAIGFALFDFLPYSRSAFVREGQKTGTVRVRILARDEREYEVVRRAGGRGDYFVSDVETGTRLAERSENVLDWVATHALGLDGPASLEALFKNAVGVPQGLITADFQGTAVQRKSVFDPLLRVEEYRDAYETLRESMSYLRDRMAGLREEIARLEEKTAVLSDRENEQTSLAEDVRRSEARLLQLAEDLSRAEEERMALDTIEFAARALEIELSRSEQVVSGCVATLAERELALAAARSARDVVIEAEPGYRRVVAATERLTGLEERRKERDALREEKSEANKLMHGIKGHIENLDAQLREADNAAQAAAELVDRVARQDELDRQLQEARMQARDAQKLDEQIVLTRRAIVDLDRSIADREGRLQEARVAQNLAGRLRETEEKLQEITSELGGMSHLRMQLQETEIEGKRLREQFDALSGEVRRRDELLANIAVKERDVADLDALLTKQQALREERARVTATLEYQKVARAELDRHHCPLLDQRCPVVTADMDTLRRFDARVTDLTARALQLEVELSALDQPIRTAGAAAVELQTLRVQAAQLEQSVRQRGAVETDLGRCRTKFQELTRAVSGERELRRAQDGIRAELAALRTRAELAAQLPVLEDQQAYDRQRLASDRTNLANLEGQRSVLKGAEEQVRTLENELEDLGDPRQEQQRLLAIAQGRPVVEARLNEQQIALKEAADRLKAILGRLQEYENVDALSDEQRRIEKENRPDYDRYFANRDAAGQLEARETAVSETATALRQASVTREGFQRRLNETLATYDKERHGALKLECDRLGKEISAENENQAHLARQLSLVEEEVSYLRRQEEKLLTRRAELAELERVSTALGFIRETIKSASPAITETLLSNISQTANDIYAEIMDDHAVELRWDRDYDVIVQRGAEMRTFSLLSGGEQMSAALAVRLALLKEMSEVDFAFFDEPTQNMDEERRTNLADQIRAVRGFDQLIVISHDDTFEHHTDNLIRLRKINEETELEAG